ncbi:hypothetical protein SLEP1_g58888 [Rubroshorea leprosula]|uniref:DUF4218 domain-containing protein n=1 Tax=Rubroshorea leprosula TaxID=152421 RepID=A0AAV5MQQ3_9ROSI|nr:hypothetical protein SLEP1_g58888 [Rubroshorea leprosula]
MRKLKSTKGNKNHVEASIDEAFILYEISHFCSHYFGDDVETSWNQPPRNYGGIGTNVLGEVDDIFQDDDRSIMQGSSLVIDLIAYQSLQLCAEGVTEVEVDANTSKEEEDYREGKDSKFEGNSDNVEDDDDSDDSDDNDD